MNDRPDLERVVNDWLRVAAPVRAPQDVLDTALARVARVGQERPVVGRRLNEWIERSPRLHKAILAAVIAAALLGAIAGAGALLQRDAPLKLDLAPPTDLPGFVRSTYGWMPRMQPVAITTLTDGSVKGRIFVDRSGAIRVEHYATPDAPEPDTYQIFSGTTMAQLAIVGGNSAWVVQDGAISEDPRVFILAAMEGGAVTGSQCDLAGSGAAASGWRYVGLEYVAGRPADHVTCGSGDLWIDIATRLTLRSQSVDPIADRRHTIEVTSLHFGEQPASLFAIAQPAGSERMTSDAYLCTIVPAGCATPEPPPPAYTPPPGAIPGPLPSLPSSNVSNGWIAFSTDGQNPGSTDITTGSDIYLVREGGEPTVIAGRAGGTTRNVCPAFSPDGTKLAYGVRTDLDRAVIVRAVDANGVSGDPVRFDVPGPGPAVCVRWSSDGTRLGYLDGTTLIVRGLDGSTKTAAAGDPTVTDIQRTRDPSAPLVSRSGNWIARLSDMQLVVMRRDGSDAHVIALKVSGTLAAWSPDGRQVLLLEDAGLATTVEAIGIDSTVDVTIVSAIGTNGARSSPGRGDVSWQPTFP
jgi:hypothetical protein